MLAVSEGPTYRGSTVLYPMMFMDGAIAKDNFENTMSKQSASEFILFINKLVQERQETKSSIQSSSNLDKTTQTPI